MRFFYSVIISAVAVAFASCGGSSKETTVTVDTVAAGEVEVNQMLNGGAVKMSETIDNLALNADDLEPREAVAVLVGYLEIEKNAQEANKRKLVLETMRKFVDVYDIVMLNHGNDMRSAISRNASATGIDLSVIAGEFRDRLHGVDEGSGIEAAPVAKPDSAVSTDSVATVISGSEASTSNPDLFD